MRLRAHIQTGVTLLLGVLALPSAHVAHPSSKVEKAVTNRDGAAIAQVVTDETRARYVRVYREGKVAVEKRLPFEPEFLQISDDGTLVGAGETGMDTGRGKLLFVQEDGQDWELTADFISSQISNKHNRVLVLHSNGSDDEAVLYSSTGAPLGTIPGSIAPDEHVEFSVDGDVVVKTLSSDATSNYIEIFDATTGNLERFEFPTNLESPKVIGANSVISIVEGDLVRYSIAIDQNPSVVWSRQPAVEGGYFSIYGIGGDKVLASHASGYDVVGYDGNVIWRLLWKPADDSVSEQQHFKNFEKWMLAEVGVENLRDIQPSLTREGVLVLTERESGTRFVANNLRAEGRVNFTRIDDQTESISADGNFLVRTRDVEPKRIQLSD